MKLIYNILLLFISNIIYCQNSNLNGRVAIDHGYKTIIYNQNDTLEFQLKHSNNYDISISSWLNKSDYFIANQEFYINNSFAYNKIILLDKKGNIFDSILTTPKKNPISSNVYADRQDSLIVFASRSAQKDIRDNYMMNLNFLRLSDKRIVKQITNLATSLTFELYDSPWSNDNQSIVFRAGHVYDMKPKEQLKIREKGIYIHSIINNSFCKISSLGRHCIWSPDGNYIVYEYKGRIFKYNVKTKKTSLIYSLKRKYILHNINWSPDSKNCIIKQAELKYSLILLSHWAKCSFLLLDTETKEILKINNLKNGYQKIFWKE